MFEPLALKNRVQPNSSLVVSDSLKTDPNFANNSRKLMRMKSVFSPDKAPGENPIMTPT